MLVAIRSCWALLLGIALIMLGNGLQGTLLGLRASLEGFTTTVTGLVMTSYYVGFLLGCTVVPKFLAKVGHIRVFAALASIASTAVLLHTEFVNPWAWGIFRLMTGFAYAGLYVVAESWLNDKATNSTRGQLLSVYMVISLGGLGFGQLLLILADPIETTLFILISVLVSLALVPISLTASSAPEFSEPEHISFPQLYQVSPLGVAGCFGIGVVHGALFGMGAVYANKMGMSVSETSYFMFVFLLGGIVLQWPIGRLSDSFGRRRIITAVTFLAMAFSLVAVFASTQSHAILLWVVCLYGGMSLPLYSICVAYTNDHLSPEQMVAASSTLVLVRGLGSVVGPMAVAILMGEIGANGIFWSLAVTHLVIGLLALYRSTQREAPPVTEQPNYLMVGIKESPVAAAVSAKSAGREQI
jgi:MFS family permease